ncbi:hypothetical protein D3C87_1601780 [compost metagenome]
MTRCTINSVIGQGAGEVKPDSCRSNLHNEGVVNPIALEHKWNVSNAKSASNLVDALGDIEGTATRRLNVV